MHANSETCSYAAVDLGGESGRVVQFQTDGVRVSTRECHRWGNRPVLLGGHLFWDFPALLEEVKAGLRKCRAEAPKLRSFGIDTWGTDFGLIAGNGELAGLPYAYRDHKNDGMPELVREILTDAELYSITGIQVMKVNTLYQLYALVRARSPLLKIARRLLFMPDLVAFFLCGSECCEHTMASTSQLLRAGERVWDPRIFNRLELPIEIMPEIAMAGADLGSILPAQAEEAGLQSLRLCASATHDTASAVAAVPACNADPWAFISSGTWSLVGTEVEAPLITEEARCANVTNEAGVAGVTRLLKNVTGLWLLRRLRQDWPKSYEYSEVVAAAESARAFQSFIDPDDPGFHNPPNMISAIEEYCRKSGQLAPQTIGDFARCVLESLAFKYRSVLQTLARLTGRSFARIHIVGGGAKNRFLNALTANATGIAVHAGPVEATAIGNGVVQALSDGLFRSVAEARAVIASSFPLQTCFPECVEVWEKHARRFHEVTGVQGYVT